MPYIEAISRDARSGGPFGTRLRRQEDDFTAIRDGVSPRRREEKVPHHMGRGRGSLRGKNELRSKPRAASQPFAPWLTVQAALLFDKEGWRAALQERGATEFMQGLRVSLD